MRAVPVIAGLALLAMFGQSTASADDLIADDSPAHESPAECPAEPSSETEMDPPESDEDSPDLADEVESSADQRIGPAIGRGTARLSRIGKALAGFSSRVPRPSGL